jgi:hypothetical protein
MNRRESDHTGLPTPTTKPAGEDRFVRHHAGDQRRHQNSDKTAADPDRRATTGLVALEQSTASVVPHLQIGVTDQATQPQSP